MPDFQPQRFQTVATAICTAVLQQYDSPPESQVVALVAQFVLAQHRRMPDFLQLPIVVLTLGFNVWSVVKGGTSFERLSPVRQQQLLAQWRNSPLSACRDLVRFYESLALFRCSVSQTPS